MILEELNVRNFGLFAGEQVFTLTPGRRGSKHLCFTQAWSTPSEI